MIKWLHMYNRLSIRYGIVLHGVLGRSDVLWRAQLELARTSTVPSIGEAIVDAFGSFPNAKLRVL